MTMLVYMVGRNIPLYGIDIDAYSNVNVDAQSILLQAISGDMKNCSIFIIGLWPYMLASMLAILIVAIMSLDNTRKLSPKKINIWTVTIMMIIAAVQAYHKTQTLMYRVSGDELIWNKIIVFIQLIAGMLIVVYMCDRATKYGIGGKVSVFMVNIVSGMMTMFTGKPLEKLALPVAIGLSSPYLASSAFVAAGLIAFSDKNGPPGTRFIRKNVIVATAQMVTIASAILLSMYLPTFLSPIQFSFLLL